MTEKAHNYELHPCDSTVLCLDYAQNGIGSASCGPRLAEQYRLDDASFDFSIRLIPEDVYKRQFLLQREFSPLAVRF